MSTTETKPFWQSKTVISGIVVVIMSLLPVFGIAGAEGQQENLTEFVFQVVTAVAGIVAIVGRFTATKQVTK